MARIAVVGAGIAGLACAQSLAVAGHAVRVFDKSRGVGGRMATRRSPAGSFDHGAQYFTVRDASFRAAVEGWLNAGLVSPYAGRIVQLVSGRAEPLSRAETRYVAVPAMTAVCRAMADGLDLALDCAVGAVRPEAGGWRIDWPGGGESGFDAVLLAVPAAQAVPLAVALPRFAAQLAAGGHQPCWAVMADYGNSLALDFDAAFIEDDVIGWVMCDASRTGRSPGARWVLHATAAWSAAHLECTPEEVTSQLLAAFHAVAGLEVQPASAKAHRWRYALSPGLGVGCFWDSAQRIGACGDWCADGRIEGAWLSGRALARRFLATA